MFHERKGFTLLEIVVVCAIFVGATIASAVFFSRFFSNARLEQAGEAAVSLLRDARDQTLARQGGYSYGVHAATSTLTLFRAPIFAAGAFTNVVYVLPATVTASSALPGGAADVVFDPLTGRANPAGDIILQKAGSPPLQKTIHIYEAGFVEIQ